MLEKFGITSQRTKNIAKQVGWSSLYKGGGIVANFLLVPLTIDYLDQENYGIWLTLSSFIAWFSVLDIGLGNGLRNKFTEAKALGEYELARAYVSCAYYTIGVISLAFAIISIFLSWMVDWTFIFNTSAELKGELQILMPVVFAFFALQLVAKLITTIYTADQRISIHVKVEFFTRILSLALVLLLTKTSESSLLVFGILFSTLPVVVLVLFNLYGFSYSYRAFRPTLKLWKKEHLKDITGIGMKFFMIQISLLILYSTDNIIIINLFGPEDVVSYNIAFKYFSAFIMIYTTIATPYWSYFTEAYVKKDFEWIKTSVKNVQKLWMLMPVGALVLILISDWFYGVWVGDEITVPFNLTLSMALYALLNTFSIIYVQFINGIGKIKIQLVLAIISTVINVPLSILFAKGFGWGLSGIILATCASLALSAILLPIQYSKIINMKAIRIWNQ